MTMDDDRDLRERFGALREEDERIAPDFGRVSSQPPSVRSPRRRALVWSGVAALVALAFLLWRPDAGEGPAPRAVIEPSITTWRSPTDFLLETPGRQLLRASPAVGRRWVEGPPL